MDEKWKKEKNKYKIKKDEDAGEERYRDWENLKYWFRSVEKFAPWVNKIHFVTCGQYPDWLNKENKKLNVVDHKDFMPQEYLPTFNANPIELNLHRINGLQEKFVLFNDDMFITRPLIPEDFFKNNLPCDQAVLSAIGTDDECFFLMLSTVMSVINKNFKKNSIIKNNFGKYFNFRYGKMLIKTIFALPWQRIIGFYYNHIPTSLLKSTYTEIWNKEFEILNETSMHKFRNKNDVTHYLMKYWQLSSGKFSPIENNYCAFQIRNELDIEKICKSIRNKKYKMICINDSSSVKNFETSKKSINEAFQDILSDKSSFEL